VERLLHEMLALVHRNILCMVRVSLRRETGFSFFQCFVPAAFISGSMDVPTLLVVMARAREAVTTVEATRATAMFAAETFA
jgi:hypothetical protein